MKKFIEVSDVTDIQALINKGLAYKQHPLLDKSLGANKRVGLLFLNPSLRTRLSTQVAAQNLGMDAIVFKATLAKGNDELIKNLKAEVILNFLPMDKALQLYKEGSRP